MLRGAIQIDLLEAEAGDGVRGDDRAYRFVSIQIWYLDYRVSPPLPVREVCPTRIQFSRLRRWSLFDR